MEQKTQGEEKQWYLLIAQVFTRFKKPIFFRSPLTFIIFLSLITVLLLLLGKNFLPPSSVPSQSKPSLFLSLESPIDSEVITDNIMEVKGETLPETTVVVFTEKDITSLKSDANGQFAGAVRLSTGLNTLTVSAFAENGEEQSIILDIIYDNHVNVKGEKTSKDEEKSKEQPPGQEKKQEQPPGQEQQQPPPEQRQEQPAREEPKQEQAPGQVKKEEPQTAIVGGVERVTSDSVVIEEKQQKKKVEAKVDESTLIKNQDDKTLELRGVKAKDEAAIIPKEEGTQPEEAKEGEIQIKEAARIFVRQATPSAQLKRRAIQGVITNIIGNFITVAHQTQTGRGFTFSVDDQTVVKIKDLPNANTNDLRVSQRIVAVGDLDENGILLARWIHVIKDVPISPTALLSISPSQPLATNIPTPISTQTPTSIPTPTLTPTPTPAPCVLVSAFWNTPVSNVVEGTTVSLGVAAKGECAGKQATFEVREYDSLLEGGVDDPISIQPSPVVFLADFLSAQTTWTAQWQNDCLGLCNPPEYHFSASLVGGNTVQSAAPLLSVERKVEPSPTPTPTLTLTPTPATTVLSARSLIVYGDDGTKCFDSDGNNQLNEHYFIKGYCQDNSGIYYDSCPDGFDNRKLSEYACYRTWNGSARCTGIGYSCSSCGQCIDGAFQDPSRTSPSLEGPTPTPFSISTTYPDTSAPVITRISPGQVNLTVSGTVTLEVGAIDNVGVTKVEFYVAAYDNQLVHHGTVTEPPYRVLWDTTKYTNNWNHIIYATAYDAENNSSAIVWYLYVSNP